MQHPTNPDLPIEGKVRFPVIKRVTGIEARSTIWRMEKAGKFPKSIRITPRLTVWDAATVREWLADPVGWAKAAASKAEVFAKKKGEAAEARKEAATEGEDDDADGFAGGAL